MRKAMVAAGSVLRGLCRPSRKWSRKTNTTPKVGSSRLRTEEEKDGHSRNFLWTGEWRAGSRLWWLGPVLRRATVRASNVPTPEDLARIPLNSAAHLLICLSTAPLRARPKSSLARHSRQTRLCCETTHCQGCRPMARLPPPTSVLMCTPFDPPEHTPPHAPLTAQCRALFHTAVVPTP
jgi:hypothetical protein